MSVVDVYHGSYNHYSQIKTHGFMLGMGTQPGVSRDIRVARDAVSDRRLHVEGLSPATADRGIITSRMPKPVFDEVLAPFERSYTGFYPYPIAGGSEILLRDDIMKSTYNAFIVR
jgi:hypothetical protein